MSDHLEGASFFAHTKPGVPESGWEPLTDHLEKVASLAAEFAAPFGASDWAQLTGLWHDLGKYRAAFQGYLHRSAAGSVEASEECRPGRVDHSTAGAIHAVRVLGSLGKSVAYLIAGHHAGLPDAVGGESSLEARLARSEVLDDLDDSRIPSHILSVQTPASKPPSRDPRELHLWIRFLFSALVDADFLATESFVEPERALSRGREWPLFQDLLPRFEAYMARTFPVPTTPVESARSEVLAACIARAKDEPGLFSLSVPTGGGKTLSSLAFALHHARHWNKRRVIYAIPYTSIIEQTADVFRRVFPEAVLEHHSNLDPDDPARTSLRHRLGAENWDAPIVVTTNIQLFESLFAAASSRCRKLHNLVGSVIVLDEAQLLPPEFLAPILHAVRALSRDYGVSLVFSTATQPAFELEGVREIAPNPGELANRLRRVQYEWPANPAPRSWEEIARELEGLKRVLCVVNRRDDARELVSLLPEDAIHLSALMCGDHRASVIAAIKSLLAAGEPVRVVSTQLVEAGVDFDFPVVYRAFAGLDSVAQAAGRCNREGRLDPLLGRVVIFHAPTPPPPGLLRKAASATAELRATDALQDLSADDFRRYFDLLYRTKLNSLDARGIMDLLGRDAARLEMQFRTAAADFRLVDESGYRPVLVSWGNGRNLREELRHAGPSAARLRRAQRFIVSLPTRQLDGLLAGGAVSEMESVPGLYAQVDERFYDSRLGLRVEVPEFEPGDLII